MRPVDNVRNLMESLNDTTSAEMDERVLGDVLQALEESNKTQSAERQPTIGRTIMKSPITRLTAAAVVAIAMLIAMSQLGGSAGSVAWGEVIRNVEASPGFIYRLRQTYVDKETGTRQFDWVVYGSAQYGIRMDSYIDPEHSIRTYGSLRQKAMISIMPSSKTYARMPLSGDQLAEFEKLDLKKSLREYLSAKYRKLGRRTIDGVEAEGIEIDDPSEAKANFQVDSCVMQLWVAVDTGLPILIDVDTVGKDGTLKVHTIQDNFQWNVELDANEFEPNIPEDYTLMEVEVDGTSYKMTKKYDSQEAAGAGIQKWRVMGKDPERGYLLQSEDGRTTANIPESWADGPEDAMRVKEELDLQKQQGNRELVGVTETEVNGQLDNRFFIYEHTLSNGRVIKDGDFDPELGSPGMLGLERGKELSQLRQKGQGQELATREERQMHGRVFVFKKQRFVLSDGTEVVWSTGRLKDD